MSVDIVQMSFDYASLDSETRVFVQEKAQAIHTRLKRTAEDIIAIGNDLIAVKDRLREANGGKRGLFLPWLQMEFDMSEAAANRFMRVASKFGKLPVNLTDISVSVIYELASAPDIVIEQVTTCQIPATLPAIRDEKARRKALEEEGYYQIPDNRVFDAIDAGIISSEADEDEEEAIIDNPPAAPLPPGFGLVNGKPFDMPLPDGKPVEIPEEWKLPQSMRGNPEPIPQTVTLYLDNAELEKELVKRNTSLAALQSSDSNEWYTPAEYVEAARELMGEIDVDPASCELANEIIKAKKYYTKKENGLVQSWAGRVWLNPPYGFDGGMSNQEVWSHQLIDRYRAGLVTEAILLVNANTEAKWFQPLYDYLICLTNHRIRFYNTDGDPSQPTQGNALVYFGPRKRRFIELFRRFGRVVREVSPDEF